MYGTRTITWADYWINCPNGDNLNICLGIASVYRVSFLLTVFHLIIMLCCLTRDEFAKTINEGLWVIKLPILILGFYASLMVPNSWVQIWADIAFYFGTGFLFCQGIMAITGSYKLVDTWQQKREDGIGCYFCLFIIMNVVVWVADVSLIYLGFDRFYIAGCETNKIVLILLVILPIVYLLLQLFFSVRHIMASILCTGLVVLYLISQAASASLNRFDQCRNYALTPWISAMGVFGQFIIALLILVKSVVGGNLRGVWGNHGKYNLGEDPDELVTRGEMRRAAAGTSSYYNYDFVKYHALMALYSAYMGSIYTNWESLPLSASTWSFRPNEGYPFYIKLLMAGIAAIAFIWTIVGQYIMSSEDESEYSISHPPSRLPNRPQRLDREMQPVHIRNNDDGASDFRRMRSRK